MEGSVVRILGVAVQLNSQSLLIKLHAKRLDPSMHETFSSFTSTISKQRQVSIAPPLLPHYSAPQVPVHEQVRAWMTSDMRFFSPPDTEPLSLVPPSPTHTYRFLCMNKSDL
jgi:hypothetical protein